MAKADKVYMNGKIYCVQPRNTKAEAVALKDGKILFVGSNEDVDSFIGNQTEVVNLEGKTVIPGLHDMHTHAIIGANKELNECKLPQDSSDDLSSLLELIESFAKQNPDKAWITGGGWSGEYSAHVHKSYLDKIDSERPIMLLDFSIHNAWVNSKALEVAGIDRETTDPEGGEIVRDEDGEPTGLLVENAVMLVQQHIPTMNKKDSLLAGEWVVKHLNFYGITCIKDALVDRQILNTYQTLDRENKLTVRVGTHLPWKAKLGGAASTTSIDEQFELVESRQQFASERVNPNFAKIYLDGVPHFKTAAFLEPYAGESEEEFDWKENLLVDPEELKQDLIKLDKMGLTVKMHATGDAAVRVGLDAIEAARKQNGFSGLLHEIVHTGFVSKEDIGRFKELKATAEFSPAAFWSPSTLHDVNLVNVLGKERADGTYPIKSVRATNAIAVYGSDWPVVSSINPWPAIEALITRENPYEDYPGQQNPNEAITVTEAIEMLTIDGARSMYLDKVTGSIEVGKSADILILDRDIFKVSPQSIRNTKVLETIFEGNSVYSYERSFEVSQ